MVCTKHIITRQLMEEISVEESLLSGEEMEVPPVAEHSEESTAEETAEEEASHRRRKAPEGRVSFKNPIILLIRHFSSLGSF